MDWASVKGWFSEQGIWLLVVLLTGVFLYWVLRRWVPRAVRSIISGMELVSTEDELKQLSDTVSRIVVWVGTAILIVAIVFGVLYLMGVDLSPVGDAVGGWLWSHGSRIGIIVVVAVFTHLIAKKLIPRIVEGGAVRGKYGSKVEFQKRVETLNHFFYQVIEIVIWVMAVFMILSELGVNIGPLIAGAGVAGIAIPFGAQSLISDVLSGFFIIIENQYSTGDWVMIAGISGEVEQINIRRTILRDLDGIVHVVPNGEVRSASNYTKEYGRVNLNISVGYGEDLDYAIQVINRVGRELADDEYWSKAVIEPPYVLRVSNLGDSGIDIMVFGDTKRVRQWEVMGELRKRIKRAFDEEGIEIPWPHTKVYFGNSPDKAVEERHLLDTRRKERVTEEVTSGKVSRRRTKAGRIPTSEEDGEGGGGGDGGG